MPRADGASGSVHTAACSGTSSESARGPSVTGRRAASCAQAHDQFAALVDRFLVGDEVQPPPAADLAEEAATVRLKKISEMVNRRAADLRGVQFADQFALAAEHVLVFLVARHRDVALARLEEIARVDADRIEERESVGYVFGSPAAGSQMCSTAPVWRLPLAEQHRCEEHRVRRGVHDLLVGGRRGGRAARGRATPRRR